MAYAAVNVTPIVTAKQFTSDYPEFADPGTYPVSSINYWLTVATILLNPARWGTALQLGVELFVAHELVLEAQALQTGQAAGWPGISKGAINSESPGEVTVSYDTAIALEADGGNWNLTVYGSRFLRWARMAGAGPVQVGPGGGSGMTGVVPGTDFGPAWSGPDCKPSGSGFGG